MRRFAAPLKVSASTKSDANPNATSKENSNASAGTSVASALGPSKVEEITSPHELTAYVEQLLNQIEGKFDDMSSQILERMNAMSTRVDALEASIQDLINASDNQQPGTPGTPSVR
ncbi:SubName: Full=Uncharacterized protein {ECO:0000313/EMBL:CCA73861.1} [Serendipita indica DSM 11827]|uniref:Heat shock factor binding protein 1 n=1 Tax=Serendipita indica (strain DSM 11827) TaxID=1109443 RepID=G4TRB8_SERID|nr:SubName: Full=Uncharacterized protein {ECO:0000313/EMBL:CCA73861.1} [Serendipita indica DSM 11827]CCA73861.1 hypothetical protein PIIN_07815 [Serendipita indica DSM 11827]